MMDEVKPLEKIEEDEDSASSIKNYGSCQTTKPQSCRGRFSITNLNIHSNSNGYDNPLFVSDESASSFPSPSKLSQSNPVVPPKNRKPSCIFPLYLRRDHNSENDNQIVQAMQSESTNNLQAYTVMNHESLPRLENYCRDFGQTTYNRPTLDELHEPSKYDVSVYLAMNTLLLIIMAYLNQIKG
jgi:hypothetical protein